MTSYDPVGLLNPEIGHVTNKFNITVTLHQVSFIPYMYVNVAFDTTPFEESQMYQHKDYVVTWKRTKLTICLNAILFIYYWNIILPVSVIFSLAKECLLFITICNIKPNILSHLKPVLHILPKFQAW